MGGIWHLSAALLRYQNPAQQQQCTLLQLPAEIRSHIYELVCTDVNKIFISTNVSACIHPLAQTCRQIRREFGSVYKAAKWQYAAHIKDYITNFQLHYYHSKVHDRITQSTGPKTYTIMIHLDNSFEKNLREHCIAFNKLIHHDEAIDVAVEIYLSYHEKSFDLDYLRRFLDRFCSGRSPLGFRMKQLAEDAISRHEAANAEEKKRRLEVRRVRKTASGRKRGGVHGKVRK